MKPQRRRPWIAALLGFLVPGWGHLYLARARRFFVPLGISVVLYATLGRIGSLSSLIGFVVALALFTGLFIFGVVDSFLVARAMNDFVPKWYNRWYFYSAWVVAAAFVTVAWQASRSELFGYASYRVPGVAMTPTIASGEYVLVDTWAYRNSGPSTGDVVVMRVPDTGFEYVRRVAKRLSTNEVEFKTDNPISMTTGPGLRGFPSSTVTGRVTYVLLSSDLARVGKRVQ